MSESLDGRVAIVVGATSGMGRATAMELARCGAVVTAAGRREERLDGLVEEISAEGLSVDTCVCDVMIEEDVEGLVEQVQEAHGRVDLLVYSTGTNIADRSLEVLTPETWDMMLATNLSGAFHATRSVLPAMRAGGGGLIIYLSTAAVQRPDVSGVAYQASKHGLTGLAHGTRVEEQANGIRTCVIFPGLCDTEILEKRPTPTPREVLDLSLDPLDVAEAVLFVARLHPRAVVPELQLLPSRL